MRSRKRQRRWDTIDTTVVLVGWAGSCVIVSTSIIAGGVIAIALAVVAGGHREDAPLSMILAVFVACFVFAEDRWRRMLDAAEADLRDRAAQDGEQST